MEARRRRFPEPVPRDGTVRLRPLRDVIQLPRRGSLAPELAAALAAAARVHELRTDLTSVPVRPTATTTEAGAYRYVRRDPVDLRVSRRTRHALLGFLHELGHFVDHQLGYDEERRAFASEWHPDFAPWRASVLPFKCGHATFDAMRELWARSYAQAILARSHDAALRAHLAALQRANDPFVWHDDDFAPVGAAVDGVFRRFELAA